MILTKATKSKLFKVSMNLPTNAVLYNCDLWVSRSYFLSIFQISTPYLAPSFQKLYYLYIKYNLGNGKDVKCLLRVCLGLTLCKVQRQKLLIWARCFDITSQKIPKQHKSKHNPLKKKKKKGGFLVWLVFPPADISEQCFQKNPFRCRIKSQGNSISYLCFSKFYVHKDVRSCSAGSGLQSLKSYISATTTKCFTTKENQGKERILASSEGFTHQNSYKIIP